jgi:hypothetical protein
VFCQVERRSATVSDSDARHGACQGKASAHGNAHHGELPQ